MLDFKCSSSVLIENEEEIAAMKRFATALLAAPLAFCGMSPALATETITYSYDAHGRLVTVQRTGTVNNNVTTTYSHDKADNRTAKVTTGAPS